MNINLITNVTGFPHGTATAKRINMIGKALIDSNNTFSVYTNCLTHNKYNNEPLGIYNGINFRYLHGSVNLEGRAIRKTFLFIKGIINLVLLLRSLKGIVYIYAQGNLFNVITTFLCKYYGLTIIEEINEWYHNEPGNNLRKFIVEGPMIKMADGAITISSNINDKVLDIKPSINSIIIPVLEDPDKYNSLTRLKGRDYCFWMGLVDGYIEDILLIIEASGIAYSKKCDYDIIISGPYNDASYRRIMLTAEQANFPKENIKLLGYIDDDALSKFCYNAFFYIVPMWDDIRSSHRFPTKIASFMFCGNPIITSKIGEIGNILTHKHNSLFFLPGDVNDLSKQIILLFDNDILYKNICKNSIVTAHKYFSYKSYSDILNAYFKSFDFLN
ncbi:hypothetical protein GCM10028803_56530 [Larkinella knui]|uniref:Glycosyltransferase family 1 protein n=1 Tax=Larkinella knui TaxID=2025310 RepID=A0A3P1CIL5_9BACT|nr:glycosyltransferase [Larkinella knui]RRB12896.1 glycosyltransferase family 1 protein [Larkinella knui]